MTDTNFLVRGSRTRQQFQLRDNREGILGGWFSRFLKHHVPVGYEDETGFHYGTTPIPNEAVTYCVPGSAMNGGVAAGRPCLQPEPNHVGCHEAS